MSEERGPCPNGHKGSVGTAVPLACSGPDRSELMVEGRREDVHLVSISPRPRLRQSRSQAGVKNSREHLQRRGHAPPS